jgi:hypothetical protein
VIGLPAISLLLTNTVSRLCRLAYPYDWRGFVEAKKKTSVSLLLLLFLDDAGVWGV